MINFCNIFKGIQEYLELKLIVKNMHVYCCCFGYLNLVSWCWIPGIVDPYIYLFIHLFTYLSFIHLFIYLLFVCLFIYLFILVLVYFGYITFFWIQRVHLPGFFRSWFTPPSIRKRSFKTSTSYSINLAQNCITLTLLFSFYIQR